MVKYYCDKCEKETSGLYTIPIYVHIKNENHLSGHGKMVDGELVPISGRTEDTDLCIKCYNDIMYSVWDKLKK